MNYYAHSANKKGIFHDLSTHLKNVAKLASENTSKWGGERLGIRSRRLT